MKIYTSLTIDNMAVVKDYFLLTSIQERENTNYCVNMYTGRERLIRTWLIRSST